MTGMPEGLRPCDSAEPEAPQARVDMRTAAFALAISRVGKAAMSRIHVGADLGFGEQ